MDDYLTIVSGRVRHYIRSHRDEFVEAGRKLDERFSIDACWQEEVDFITSVRRVRIEDAMFREWMQDLPHVEDQRQGVPQSVLRDCAEEIQRKWADRADLAGKIVAEPPPLPSEREIRDRMKHTSFPSALDIPTRDEFIHGIKRLRIAREEIEEELNVNLVALPTESVARQAMLVHWVMTDSEAYSLESQITEFQNLAAGNLDHNLLHAATDATMGDQISWMRCVVKAWSVVNPGDELPMPPEPSKKIKPEAEQQVKQPQIVEPKPPVLTEVDVRRIARAEYDQGDMDAVYVQALLTHGSYRKAAEALHAEGIDGSVEAIKSCIERRVNRLGGYEAVMASAGSSIVTEIIASLSRDNDR